MYSIKLIIINNNNYNIDGKNLKLIMVKYKINLNY